MAHGILLYTDVKTCCIFTSDCFSCFTRLSWNTPTNVILKSYTTYMTYIWQLPIMIHDNCCKTATPAFWLIWHTFTGKRFWLEIFTRMAFRLHHTLEYDTNLVPEAGFNICGWLSQKFSSNAASRIFFGWLMAYKKFGLNPAYSHCTAFHSCTFCFSSSMLLNTVCTVTVYLC